jgi:hypothetical protein
MKIMLVLGNAGLFQSSLNLKGSLPKTTTALDVMDYHDSCPPERSLQHFWKIIQAAESHQTERIN